MNITNKITLCSEKQHFLNMILLMKRMLDTILHIFTYALYYLYNNKYLCVELDACCGHCHTIIQNIPSPEY